jgi:hypothetical protein
MVDPMTMVFHMSDSSEHLITVPRDQVDSLLADVSEAMRMHNQLVFPTAKMLFNGAHIVAVVPKVVTP